MVIDLVIIFPIIGLTALGMRDGMTKKGVALAVTLAAVVVAHVTMNDVAKMYVKEFDIDQSAAVFYAYFSVFFGLIILQSLIFRLTAHDYKIGGLADRVVGACLGLIQGIFIMSVIFMMLSVQGFPSRTYRIDSRLYGSVVNVAPQFLDFVMTTVPETGEELKEKTQKRVDEFTKPDDTKKDKPTEKK